MKRIYAASLWAGIAWAVVVTGCDEAVTSGSGDSGVILGAVSSELEAAAPAAAPDADYARAAAFDTVVPDSGFPATDADGTTFFIDTALGYVRHIELDLADGTSCSDFEAGEFTDPVSCDAGSDKIIIAGPFIVDLVEATSTPDLADVGIPAGVYKRIDVRFDDAEVSEGLVAAESPLNENTLYIAGTFVFDPEDEAEVEKTFEMALQFNEDVRFEHPGVGIVLEEGAVDDLAVELDVALWFDTLPITTCIDDGDLVIDGQNHLLIADSGDCSTVENDLKEAMKTSGQLDKD